MLNKSFISLSISSQYDPSSTASEGRNLCGKEEREPKNS